MGRIQNHWLGIDVEIPGVEITNHGRVDSMEAFLRKTCEIDGADPDELLPYVSLTATGRIQTNHVTENVGTSQERSYDHLHYAAVADHPAELIRIISHEETHILHMMGKLKLLQPVFDKHSLSINLSQYPEHKTSHASDEFIAHLGGFAAADTAGYRYRKSFVGNGEELRIINNVYSLYSSQNPDFFLQ